MRSLEIFGGCGGLALGLSRAGFRDKVLIEVDPHAIGTLRANKERGVDHFRDWHVVPSDIHLFPLEELGENLDLVSGGPPCQPFSIGGRHRGPADERNLWPQAVRAVRTTRPKAFLFENVRGLLRPAFADYLSYITLQLRWPSLGPRELDWREHARRLAQHDEANVEGREYAVVVRGINAADFGAAQKRHRAIVMGVRSDIASDWQPPLASHSQGALVWDKWVSCAYWGRNNLDPNSELTVTDRRLLATLQTSGLVPTANPWVTVRNRLRDLPPPGSNKDDPNHYQHPGARTYRNHTGSVPDEPAKALKAGDHGVPGGENMLVLADGSVRYFTVREMARLQGLPDDAIVVGTWRHVTRQLGNAVPAEVGEAFGRELFGLIQPGQATRIAA
jgi:DNA (cytosine-5)-methyltransferase 1